MHVASVMLFEGDPPLRRAAGDDRPAAAPRCRATARSLPSCRWARAARGGSTIPHLNLRYHVRSTALPSPGSEDQLRDLAGRVFAQQLDRDKPLWEIWLVEGLEDGGFALLSKTHHALVDGISGVDIMIRALRHVARARRAARPGPALAPAPGPPGAQLLGEALMERATVPGEMRALRARGVPGPAADRQTAW